MSEGTPDLLKQKKKANFWYKQKKSQFIRDMYKKIYGNDYPEEADPDSFVTMTDLHNIVKFLNVKPGETFIDIGCGRAGPGMWIAREMSAKYVGIDISEIAIELASQRIVDFGLKDKAKFLVANICATNFSDNYYDGAISIDTLTYIPDKMKAICEIARILQSDASFVFTTWETPATASDYRPLLRKAGFKIMIYNEISNWEQLQHDFYEKVIEFRDILIRDMGKDGSLPWIKEAKENLPYLKDWRRIFGVAKKK